MDATDTLLIVGGGQAGGELAISARQNGWLGRIVLIGEETHLPYHRPPLSKAYLCGKAEADGLSMRPAEAYAKAGVSLRLGVRVSAVDRAARALTLADGERLGYTHLALCLGARARLMQVDGLVDGGSPVHVPNVHYLRSRADAEAIRRNLRAGARLVVIGGGYVGLEVAASARALGAEVTILEAQSRVLARVTGPEVSAFYEQVHRDAGVDLRTGVCIERIERESDGDRLARAAVTTDGERIAADLIIVGVGGLPNVELATAAGLEVEGGIVVDAFCRTSDEHIHAAGDCTVHPSAVYGRRLRLESVPNALEQARVVAAALCGKPKAYDSVPWFWSDQYDLKLQMVGLAQGHDRFVLRGSTAARSFSAFYLREGRLLAADAVNRPGDFLAARRLIAARVGIDAERLADEAVPLKTLLDTAA